MAAELDKTDKDPNESRTLSIQVEPSPPLILAMSELFRQHKQPQKAIELCRHGLSIFPGDMGMRLTLAMVYLDLNQQEEAWLEINKVTQELQQLSPVLEKISACTNREKQGLSGWFTRLSQILAQYPEKGPSGPVGGMPEVRREENPSASSEDKDLVSDSNIISTLDNWVSQLKKDNT
jgi:hypothetical protein